MGLGGIAYYSTSPFADTMRSGGDWLEFTNDFGSRVPLILEDGSRNPQFNQNGFPNYLPAGKRLRTLCWPYGLNSNNGRPAGWPLRNKQGVGKWVLTWKGNADIRLVSGNFLATESNAPATGAAVDGRRVYLLNETMRGGEVTVESIVSPVTNIELWLPDPAAPQTRSLENSGSMWHPEFLATLGGMNHLRMMDWIQTNASPQQDWADRRLPSFRNQDGILNPRSPAQGVVAYNDSNGTSVYFSGNRATGVAFEHLVRLCNDTNTDLWINIPHLATDDFISKLAQLIRFGSDGVNPYSEPQANPIYPPLNSNLRIYIEYSNEIWSGGDSFPQGNWAQAQAVAAGLTRPVFVARQIANIWSAFRRVFGESSQLVNVAGLYTANNEYGRPLLQELREFGAQLSPPVTVDVIAPTTYFGNGIQDWIYEQALSSRGTSKSWFLTTGNFVVNQRTSETHPVSIAPSDPYWAGDTFKRQLGSSFMEWKKRMLSGSSASGGGFDSTGALGGFSANLITESIETLGFAPKVISYEGGPSLYTDYLDYGDTRDDGITIFLEAMNRRPEFKEIYLMQLNAARWKGLDTHTMFVDVSAWGKFGQWGHFEYPGQPLNQAVKRQAVDDAVSNLQGIRKGTDAPLGAGGRPIFSSPCSDTLPLGVTNSPYLQEITLSGGDPDPSTGLRVAVIGSVLSQGISVSTATPGKVRISGTPKEGGWNYLFLRASDKDGDAAWKIFSFYVAGGPGTLIESDPRGSFNGTTSLPWTKTHALDAQIAYSGLRVGREYQAGNGTATKSPEPRDGVGVRLFPATDRIQFSVDQAGSNEADATLESALADQEYLSFTITPKGNQTLNLKAAELAIRWVRDEYHAPRRLAVFSSVEGFSAGREIFTSTAVPRAGEPVDSTFRFPESASYSRVSGPIEIRIYFFGSQYAHKAALLGVKLTRDSVPYFSFDPVLTTAIKFGTAYRSTLAGSALSTSNGTITYSKSSGPNWLVVSANGSLTGTPGVGEIGLNRFIIVATDSNGTSGSADLEIDVQKNPQTIGQLTAPADRNFSSTPISVSLPKASSGLPVILSVKSGPATLSGNAVVPNSAGTIVLAVNQPGNATFSSAPEVTASFIIRKIPQTITPISRISNQAVGAQPLKLTPPSASSGLPVTLSVKSGPATIADNVLTMIESGNIVLAANQLGNATIAAAPEVTISFSVLKLAQTIQVFPNYLRQNQGTSLTITPPVANSGLPVELSVKSGNATLTGNVLSFSSPGTMVLSAKQPGNAQFNAAPEVLVSITVGKPLATLQVATPDPSKGTITPGFAGTSQRELDLKYTMTATPASGMRFVEWRRNGSAHSTTPAISFAMEQNLRWEAVFAPNFALLAGTYAGLLGDGSVGGDAADQTSFASWNGFVELTIASTGQFTARVTLDGIASSFSGNFSGSTVWPLVLSRPAGSAPLSIDLKLEAALPGKILGTIGRGTDILPVQLLRTAYRGSLPSHPLSGQTHSLVFSKAPTPGYRFARLVTSSIGTASLAVFLENGQSPTFQGGFADDGAGNWVFPFYIPLADGILQGECVIPKANTKTAGGSAEWLRTATPGHLWSMDIDGARITTSSGKSLITGNTTTIAVQALMPDGNATVTLQGQWPSSNVPTFIAPSLPSFRFAVDSSGQISGSYSKAVGSSRTPATFRGRVFPSTFAIPGTSAKTIGVGHVTTPQGSAPFTIVLP